MNLRGRGASFLFFLSIFSLSFLVRDVPAEEFPFPVCEISDSALTIAAGLDDVLHLFGSDLVTYPNEFDVASTFPAFAQVFDLYLTDGVSDRWSQSEFEDLISAIMNNDTTETDDDVFGIIWGYFVRDEADSNDAHAGVRFAINSVTFTKIIIRLYDSADIPIPCPPTYTNACNGYSFYESDTNKLTVNASPISSMGVVLGLGIGHELQHLCWAANGRPGGYESANETMSTLAEYLLDSWRGHYSDIPYDATVLRQEVCDANSKYEVEKIWATYLYEAYKGNEADPADDLIHRWIHGDLPSSTRMRLSGLAATLWDSDFEWLGGVDATDRLSNVFAHFLVAKFCNAPTLGSNGQWGIGSVNTVKDFSLFVDNCDFYAIGATPMTPVDCPTNTNGYPGGHNGCWNVRVLAPTYELSDDNENAMTHVAGIYEDGDASVTVGDGSTDYIDVWQYGTDYVTFRSGEYYDDGEAHELEIRVGGNAKYRAPSYGEVSRLKPVGWVIGYCCDKDTLQTHPEDIVFVEPLTFSPSTTLGDTVVARPVIVTEFGRSVKAVVLAIGATSLSPNIATFPLNAFVYEYEYGAFTPDASTRTWDGNVYVLGDITVPDDGTLEIGAGTYVRVFSSDLAEAGADDDRVEFNVEGELIVGGTDEAPVTIHPWAQTTSEDWVGFYFSEDSDGGTFNHCTIGYAEYVIDSYAPIEIDNATIRGASGALISMWGTTLDINNSTIGLSNGDCIRLDDTQATIDSTIIEDYHAYGVYAEGNQALNITNCAFLGDSIAVHVMYNTTNGVIANSTFEGNHTAISYYSATEPDIDECVITGNTIGVRCDYYASPTIEHCITSTNYAGNIRDNGSGIFCTDHSDPAIGSCNIETNGAGVLAFDYSEPALQGFGANKLISNIDYHVVNLTSGVTIAAQGNYWYQNTGTPNYAPRSTKILGSVDYANALSSGPNPVSSWPGVRDPEPAVVTGLGRAHPNPFNPTVQIPYALTGPAQVDIAIYDVAGRLVRTLVRGPAERGQHAVTWSGRDDRGVLVASSVYFVRMRAGNYMETQKIVLLK